MLVQEKKSLSEKRKKISSMKAKTLLFHNALTVAER